MNGHHRPPGAAANQYSQADYEKLKNEVEQKRLRLEELMKQVTCQTKDELRNEVLRLCNKKRELSDRIATGLHHQIASNEENFENISIRNRPLNVAEEYQHFLSNEWTFSMEELEKHWPKEEKQVLHVFLRDIVEVSYEEAQMLHTEALIALGMPGSDGNPSISQEVINELGDFWRETADQTETNRLFENIHKKLDIKYGGIPSNNKPLTEALKQPSTRDYTEKAATLAWKMAIQRPPLEIFMPKKGDQFTRNEHDVFFDSKDPSKFPVQYSVHYGLKQGKNVLAKARAVFAKVDKEHSDTWL